MVLQVFMGNHFACSFLINRRWWLLVCLVDDRSSECSLKLNLKIGLGKILAKCILAFYRAVWRIFGVVGECFWGIELM